MTGNTTLLRDHCALCGEGDYSPEVEQRSINSNIRAFKHESFRVWRCPKCLSIHSLDVIDTTPYFKDYPLTKRRTNFRTALYFNKILGQMRRAGMKRSSSILDFGCFNSNLVKYINGKGYNHCRGYNPSFGFHNDPDVLKQKYDVVICNDTLEFSENPRDHIQRMIDLTAPGGILIIEATDAAAIDLGSGGPEVTHLVHQPYLLHILSEKALRQIAADAGVKVLFALPRRYGADSYWPTANWKFTVEYMNSIDNTIDAVFEPPRIWHVLRSPKLFFYAIFGQFFSHDPDQIMLILQKPSKNIEKFTALDYILSIGSFAVLAALDALFVYFCFNPLTRKFTGDFHIFTDLAMFLLGYGLLTGMLLHWVLKIFPIRPGTYNMDSPEFFRWKYVTMLIFTADALMQPLVPIAFRPLKLRLFGAKVDGDTAIGGTIESPFLITLGKGSTIGHNSFVTGTVTSLEKFIVGEVKIGKDVTIGMNAVIMPDVEIGEGAVVEIGSVVMPGSRIPPGERWKGNPARKWA